MMKLLIVIVLVLIIVKAGESFRFNKYYVKNGQQSRFNTIESSYKLSLLTSKTSLLRRISTSSLHVSTNDDILVTDEELEEWLDDMMYSGDISGYVERNSRKVVNQDFIEYIGERIVSSKDEDEKLVLTEISSILTEKVRITEGLVDSDLVFETRLDNILFTAPNKRKEYVEEIKDLLTNGFVEFIQNELKSTEDQDGKVVLASVLQLIGNVKGSNFLGEQTALLKKADASLGEEYAKPELSISSGVAVGERNERILAALLFSERDIVEDVLNNLHEINEDFTKFLQDKIDGTKDMEERVGLGSLLDTITAILDRVKDVQGENIDTADEELSIDVVKQRMREVQSGTELDESGRKKAAEMFSVQVEKKDTFMKILERFQNLPEGSDLVTAVEANYDLCDYEFMQMLKSEEQACYTEGADIEAKFYSELYDTIRQVMTNRIGSAQDKLAQILSKKTLPAMESEIVAMVRKNQIDEALILLIEANIQQAENNGAQQAADVLRKLNKRIQSEKEKQLPDETRLLRALMKISDSEERKGLLYNAFKPSKIMNSDSELEEGPPLISPPLFINTVKQFIQSFGNMEGFDIRNRALSIIDEAEIVATDIWGPGMTARDQQRLMWEKKSVSVWDLADYEHEAEMTGGDVPWRNDKYDTQSPEDVLSEKVRRVGGSDDPAAGANPGLGL